MSGSPHGVFAGVYALAGAFGAEAFGAGDCAASVADTDATTRNIKTSRLAMKLLQKTANSIRPYVLRSGFLPVPHTFRPNWKKDPWHRPLRQPLVNQRRG